jgi:hypothetical protein
MRLCTCWTILSRNVYWIAYKRGVVTCVRNVPRIAITCCVQKRHMQSSLQRYWKESDHHTTSKSFPWEQHTEKSRTMTERALVRAVVHTGVQSGLQTGLQTYLKPVYKIYCKVISNNGVQTGPVLRSTTRPTKVVCEFVYKVVNKVVYKWSTQRSTKWCTKRYTNWWTQWSTTWPAKCSSGVQSGPQTWLAHMDVLRGVHNQNAQTHADDTSC